MGGTRTLNYIFNKINPIRCTYLCLTIFFFFKWSPICILPWIFTTSFWKVIEMHIIRFTCSTFPLFYLGNFVPISMIFSNFSSIKKLWCLLFIDACLCISISLFFKNQKRDLQRKSINNWRLDMETLFISLINCFLPKEYQCSSYRDVSHYKLFTNIWAYWNYCICFQQKLYFHSCFKNVSYSSQKVIKYIAWSPKSARVKAPSEFRSKIEFLSWNFLWFTPWKEKAILSAEFIWAISVQTPFQSHIYLWFCL